MENEWSIYRWSIQKHVYFSIAMFIELGWFWRSKCGHTQQALSFLPCTVLRGTRPQGRKSAEPVAKEGRAKEILALAVYKLIVTMGQIPKTLGCIVVVSDLPPISQASSYHLPIQPCSNSKLQWNVARTSGSMTVFPKLRPDPGNATANQASEDLVDPRRSFWFWWHESVHIDSTYIHVLCLLIGISRKCLTSFC